MDDEKYIDNDLLFKYEFYNYGHALEILYNAYPAEWKELQECLRKLKLTCNGGCPILAIGIGKECVEGYGGISEYHTRLIDFYRGEEV